MDINVMKLFILIASNFIPPNLGYILEARKSFYAITIYENQYSNGQWILIRYVYNTHSWYIIAMSNLFNDLIDWPQCG